MYTMIVTTCLEAAMFIILNINLFDGTTDEKIFRVAEAWGLGTWVQILLIEVLSAVHLGLFVYLCAISYEYYCMACDDPSMIQAEHDRLASEEKHAAGERKRQ